jgi:hypothetical protein
LFLLDRWSGADNPSQTRRLHHAFVEHRFGQSAGERVLLAGMVTAQNYTVVVQDNLATMSEFWQRTAQPAPDGGTAHD